MILIMLRYLQTYLKYIKNSFPLIILNIHNGMMVFKLNCFSVNILSKHATDNVHSHSLERQMHMYHQTCTMHLFIFLQIHFHPIYNYRDTVAYLYLDYRVFFFQIVFALSSK